MKTQSLHTVWAWNYLVIAVKVLQSFSIFLAGSIDRWRWIHVSSDPILLWTLLVSFPSPTAAFSIFISVSSSIHLTYSHYSMPSLPFSLPPCYVREMLTWGQDNGTNLCVHLRVSPNRPLRALTRPTFHTAVSTIAAQTRAHVTHDSISQEVNKPVYTGG